MGSEDIVSRLIEGLEAAANSDANLRAAIVRQEAIDCIDQGLAVEGLIDLSPLRHHLLDRGAPRDAVVNAMGQLSAIAAAAGLTPSSPPSIPSPAQAPASAQAPEPDGFIPGEDIRREKDKLDRALVSVVVRNADLNVDMEQFRDHLKAALDAGRATGAVELEAVYEWLKSTGSTETACQETVLSLVSLGGQAKTKYQLGLPSALKAMTEAQQKEILDAFNKRCPPQEAQPTPQPRGPKPDEKKAATPAWVPEKPEKKKKKSAVGPLMAVIVLLGAGGGFLLFSGEEDYKPVGETLKLPPGTMPCTMLLKRGNGIFCGLKPAAWTSLSESHGADVKDMKKKTIDAATSAGFVGVTFGLDTSR